jgi:transcriptional regulator with XRE-family HTH domain
MAITRRTKACSLDVEIGRRLRNQRSIRGLSQTQLGLCLDVAFQQIQKYERGADRIAASRLYQVAKRLGVPITYFYDDLDGRRDTGKQPIIAEANVHSRESLSLLHAYYQVTDPKKRRKIYDLIRSIADVGEKPA